MAISDILFAFTVLFTITGTVVQYKFNYNYTLREDIQLQTQLFPCYFVNKILIPFFYLQH